MSRHRTVWKYIDKGNGGTFIKIGFVRSSESAHAGYKYDCIRIHIRSGWEGAEDLDFCVRLDEASSISAGFSKVCADMLMGKYGKRDVKNHAEALEKKLL